MIPILIILVLIYVVILITTKTNVTIKQLGNWLRLIVVVGVFVLYLLAYRNAPLINNEEPMVAILRAAEYSARILVMMVDYKGVETAMQDPIYYWSFAVAIYLAVILFALTAISLFARKGYGWFRFITRFRKETYIFTNSNEESFALADNIMFPSKNATNKTKKKHKANSNAAVIFINKEEDSSTSTIFNKVEELKGAYIKSEEKNLFNIFLESWRWHIKRTNCRIFYISDDESSNVADAIKLVDYINKSSRGETLANKVHLYVRFFSNDIREAFEASVNKSNYKIDYTVFSDAELIAYDIIDCYPPVDSISIDTNKGVATENYEVMIVGFDRKGSAILSKLIEFGQFVGSKFKATIIDKDIERKRGSFSALYPAVEENYNLVFEQTFVGESHFFEVLKQEVSTLKQIVVALGSDSNNAQTALEVHRLLIGLGREDIQILTVVSYDENYNYIHNSIDLASIKCVGQQSIIYTEDKVVRGVVSKYAQEINERYRNGDLAKPTWESLDYIKKESNFSGAIHAYTKKALLGLSSEELLEFKSEAVFIKWLSSNPERYANLAKTEHLRWNALYFTRGWQKWDISQIPETNKAGRDVRRKLHCCLVDWDQLYLIDEFMGQKVGTYQGYDTGIVNNLWRGEIPKQEIVTELSDEIKLPDLSEMLAKHVHDTWMQGRLDDGWVLGDVRDDAKKIHPSLVEYEELSEQEKNYDRRTSQATINFILSKGYEIKK